MGLSGGIGLGRRRKRLRRRLPAGQQKSEKVVHVKDKEHGYEVMGVSPMARAAGDFIA